MGAVVYSLFQQHPVDGRECRIKAIPRLVGLARRWRGAVVGERHDLQLEAYPSLAPAVCIESSWH